MPIINGIKKGLKVLGFDSATESISVNEIDPENTKDVSETLQDTTNVSAATHYYPDANGANMSGFNDMSFTGKLIDADGTLTITFEATNDEDAASADWIDISQSGYDANGHAYGNSNITVTNGTVTFAWSFDNFNWRLYRVKLVASGATNTVIVKQRRKV